MAGDQPRNYPAAPAGPTYMPQYRQPAKARAAALNAQATRAYAAGEKAGSNSDDYVRTTLFLATVLFLAGIGSHFDYRAIRYGLAGVASGILVFAIVLLAHGAKAVVLSSQISQGPTSMCCSQAKTQQFGHHRRVDRAWAQASGCGRPTKKGRRGGGWGRP